MKPINNLPPFKRLCVTIGNLPSSYVDSMSYYECLMWLCKYLKDTVVPAINENAEAVNELINWFNNLDVQDEIDNKLDEMAESGQLQEIISEYLNSKAIFGFDTKDDMLNSPNLIDGSYAKTLGINDYSDGDGSIYKIRNITNSDIIDNDIITPMNTDDNLIAEKIPYSNSKELFDEINARDLTEMVVIGDSFSSTTYCPYNNSWYKIVADKLHLNVHNYSKDGAGYNHVTNNHSFTTEVTEATNDTSYDHNKVKYVFVYGGLNDMTNDDYDLAISGAKTIYQNLQTTFPNAQIIVMGINSWEQLTMVGNHNQITMFSAIKNNCMDLPIVFINTTYWLLIDYESFNLQNDHPNELGNKKTAHNLLNALNGRSFYRQINKTDTGYNLTYRFNDRSIEITGNVSGGNQTIPNNYNILSDAFAPHLGYPIVKGVNAVGFIVFNSTTLGVNVQDASTYYVNMTLQLP